MTCHIVIMRHTKSHVASLGTHCKVHVFCKIPVSQKTPTLPFESTLILPLESAQAPSSFSRKDLPLPPERTRPHYSSPKKNTASFRLLVMSKQYRNKRSTNVLQTFRYLIGMKPNLISLPNFSYRNKSFLFGPGAQILDQIETICFQIDKFGNDTKTVWFRSQNDIGTFVPSFCHYYVIKYIHVTLSFPSLERIRFPSCSSRKEHSFCSSNKNTSHFFSIQKVQSHSFTRSFVFLQKVHALPLKRTQPPFLFLQKEHASFSFPRKNTLYFLSLQKVLSLSFSFSLPLVQKVHALLLFLLHLHHLNILFILED